MTAQLRQAIALLQYSSLELGAYIEAEIEQNPFLERKPEAKADTPPVEPTTQSEGWQASSGVLGDGKLDFAGDPEAWAARKKPVDAAEAPWGLEQTLARPETLAEHLAAQLALDIADATDRVIGARLIDLLDEAGYLSEPLDGLAALLSVPLGRIEAVLTRLQQFDPPGVFARSLAECLALQLKDRNRFDPAMAVLLENLPLLARRDRGPLLSLCGVDAEDLEAMIAEVKALDPKPGLAFDQTPIAARIPEVILRKGPENEWIVELNPETLPKLLVNHRYFQALSDSAKGRADKAKTDKTRADHAYLSERHQRANWLLKALHQRAITILKVTAEIVRQQDGFFRRGVQHLRPLALRDIAQAIGMHESTVSRVTANKYLLTERGIFELKYFFTAAIASASGGEAHSAEAVRSRIKTLIENEADAVLSDQQIVLVLEREGVTIARRTVAKYREAMRIPSSIERQQEKTPPRS